MNNKSQLRILNDQSAISALVILLAFVGTYFYLLPLYKDSQTEKYQNKAKLAELQETSQKMESLKNLIASSKVKAEARGVNFAQFKNVYPSTEQMPEMVVQLDQIKAENKALDMKYTLSAPENDGITAKMKLSVQATGSYLELKGLVDRLQRNIRPVIFEQVSIVVDENGKTSLSGTGYVQVKSISSTYLSK